MARRFELMARFGANPLRPALACIVAILALGAAAPMTQPARTDRDWYPYLAHTAHVELSGEHFTVAPVSAWNYEPSGPTDETYVDVFYAIDELRDVWFMLEPQPGSQLAAHTLLLFEFEGDRILGLTIEARRERNEDYSALRGLFNAFELAYVWGTARDFLTRRVVMLDHQVFIYPVAIGDDQKRSLLVSLLQRTQALAAQPRYYNTVVSNCTNELAKAAELGWTPAFILTGRSDEYLYRRGIIPGASFQQTHRRSDMASFVRALNAAPPAVFDRELLAELRRRFGATSPASAAP